MLQFYLKKLYLKVRIPYEGTIVAPLLSLAAPKPLISPYPEHHTLKVHLHVQNPLEQSAPLNHLSLHSLSPTAGGMAHVDPWQQCSSLGFNAASCTTSHNGLQHPSAAPQSSPDERTVAHKQGHTHLVEGSADWMYILVAAQSSRTRTR